ncbi:MAG TPA: flagellar biosynthesis protein FlgI [Planctomycetaceae bacterium]|nr:flagellar biosynthesis protein FlgI [Planctomycetaceae bacterium]
MNPWKDKEEPNAKLDKLLKVPEMPDLVRQATIPHGLTFVSVEGVAAVNRLPGTGGSVPPSGLRDELIDEMKKHEVPDPSLFLELPETALVRVQAIIPPGVRRGDPIDLRIISPPQTSATDFNGGWLMDTRLRQQQTLSGMVRRSDVLVVGTGQIFTRADSEGGEDMNLKIQGVVLGGGRVQQDRKLGLVIRPEYQHVKLSAKLAEAINQRLYFYDGATRGGIATAREDDFIEIGVHPRYRRNIHRMMAVIGNVVAAGVATDTQHRLIDLGKKMNEPTTAADAAMQLEALGEPAVPTLLEAMKNPDDEIRFYAAEALAYLDRSESIEALEKAAADQPAFRYSAIVALEGMDGRASLDALQRLTNKPSIETRYGALRSIRRRSDGQVVMRPVKMGGVDFYHVTSEGPSFIAVSVADRPEIACFGEDAPIKITDFLMGPGGLIVRPEKDDPTKMRVSRFRPGHEDKRATVPATISGLISGVTLTGGDYGTCVSLLRNAKSNQFITCGLAIDPLPQAMRTYHRDDKQSPSDPANLPPDNFTPEPPKESESPWWVWWKRSEA